MYKTILFLLFLVSISSKLLPQPYIDIANFNYQSFNSKYKENTNSKNQTNQYNLNLFFPKEFKNGNAFLLRLNSEVIQTSNETLANETSKLSSISMGFGFQWVSESKKWKTIIMGIPKLASNFKEPINADDWQYGGYILENYILNEKIKIKAGLYYNREAFGDFFVPLLGIDWKASPRLNFYGILPNNYKIEYMVLENKGYAGINFKSLIRTFQLSQKQNNDYVRFDEIVVKAFADYCVFNRILFFGEVGYSIGKTPIQYNSLSDELTALNTIYKPAKNNLVINIGIAYRIRNDLNRKIK